MYAWRKTGHGLVSLTWHLHLCVPAASTSAMQSVRDKLVKMSSDEENLLVQRLRAHGVRSLGVPRHTNLHGLSRSYSAALFLPIALAMLFLERPVEASIDEGKEPHVSSVPFVDGFGRVRRKLERKRSHPQTSRVKYHQVATADLLFKWRGHGEREFECLKNSKTRVRLSYLSHSHIVFSINWVDPGL